MWKETAGVQCKLQYQNMAKEIGRKIKTAGIRGEILNWDIPDAKQKC